jgi:hypothetical protein
VEAVVAAMVTVALLILWVSLEGLVVEVVDTMLGMVFLVKVLLVKEMLVGIQDLLPMVETAEGVLELQGYLEHQPTHLLAVMEALESHLQFQEL